jgi:Ca2+/H+ antiporter, TMEM165/GDT1 family
MLQDILIPLIAVGLAELGDKTQLAVFCLASKTKKYFQLILGVLLGFAVANGLAILLGDFLTNFVPENIIKITAGLIFLFFGIITFLNKEQDTEKCELKKPFMSGFLIILMCEMGDKTQIASGLFATKFNPILVFIGVMLALTIVSLMAIFLGSYITKKIDRKKISYIAGSIFLIIGLWTLISIFI